MLYFTLGLIVGTMIFEPIVINFIYFSNVSLFIDIILTKKNKDKLRRYFTNNGPNN